MSTRPSRKCRDCPKDISDRGRRAIRCKECAKAAIQAQSILQQEKRAELKVISGGNVTRKQIEKLRKRQKGKCAQCNRRFWGRGKYQETIDHHVPLIRGGLHDDSNIKRLVCRSCNSSKGSKSPREWEELVRRRETSPQPQRPTNKEKRKLAQISVRFRDPRHVELVRAAAAESSLPTNKWIANILVDAAQRSAAMSQQQVRELPPLEQLENDLDEYPDDTDDWDRETGWVG